MHIDNTIVKIIIILIIINLFIRAPWLEIINASIDRPAYLLKDARGR